jgi:signal transduction histidine kinase
VRVIGTFRDITGQKSDRDAIQAANEKLNLLGSVTRHDILNQVMVALGYLALLDEMVPGGSELQEYCRKATEATKRIQRQITFTRDYQNLGIRSPEWQLIADIVHHSADAGSGIRIMVKTGSLEIFADPLLERVFFNLFDNATRHGDHVTEIVIGFQEEENQGILTVEDNGIGIPDDRKIHIFERGYGRNSGLGLFLAREILDITGLCIREAGKPGKGARFEITVPVGLYRFSGQAGPE